MAEDKIYTIPLRKEWLKVSIYKRSGKAIRAIKIFLKKHLKKEVKLGPYLNEFVWGRGNRHPPGKVKVRIDELKEATFAELINAPKIEEKKVEEKKKGKKVEVTNEDKEKEKKVEEKKEETKKAIEKVPEDNLLEKLEKIEEVEPQKRAMKKEKIIPTEKSGQLRKD